MNDRLQIAAMAMQTLLKRAKKPFTFQEIAHDALGYADALIAAAGEGVSEKLITQLDENGDTLQFLVPQEPSLIGKPILAEIEHINDLGKSKWFEVVYYDDKWHSYAGSKTFQDGERVIRWNYAKYCLKPSVPSVEEIFEQAIKCRNVGRFAATQVANGLHQWLTERGAK